MERNLATEFLRFYNWLEYNPINSDCIVLWHALMYVSNNAGLGEWITVPIATLESKARLSRTALYKARNTLEQVGRIEVKKRKGNQCAAYRLCPIYAHKPGRNPGHNPEHNSGRNSGRIPGTYNNPINPNGIKDSCGGMRARGDSPPDEDEYGNPLIDPAWKRVADRYMEQLGMLPTGVITDDLMDLTDALGADVVCTAIDHTNRSQPTSAMPFLVKVLRNWQELGITTVAAALENIEKRKAPRERASFDGQAHPAGKVVDAQRYTQRDYSAEELDSLYEKI